MLGPTAVADARAWVTQAPIAAAVAALELVAAAADAGDEPFGVSKIGTIPKESKPG
jgi:hypothetical protein